MRKLAYYEKKLKITDILYSRISLDKRSENIKGTVLISLYSVLVGIVSGFGAIAFRYAIGFFHNLFFVGKLSFEFNSDQYMTSHWNWCVIFVPVAGMIIVNFLTEKFAKEAKGHGVPEVMNAVLENRGVIRPVVALVKILASSISIGSGGSVGREGPIVQIGASFGSTLGQLLKFKTRDLIILVSAGVAGGIAGTFNAPISGVAFAFELILPEFSIMTLLPLVVSATVSTYIVSIFLGSHPAFIIPSYHFVSPYEFIFYIILGVFAAFAAILYIATLYKTEDIFNDLPLSPYIKGVIGSLLLGITGYIMYTLFGHYYIFGVGYPFITDTLMNNYHTLYLLAALVILKIFANSLTLGAGGSGGIFAPSLFIGIAVGAFVGTVANYFFPSITAPISAYALVGMAAVVAGTTGASFTAIIMTFEMTRNYEIMLPLMLSVVISHFLTRLLYKETIYTKKLTRRGIYIQTDKVISVFKLTSINEAVRKNFIFAMSEMEIKDVMTLMIVNRLGVLPVVEEGTLKGIVYFMDIYHLKKSGKLSGHITTNGNFEISSDMTLLDALTKMDANNCNLLIVTDKHNKIIGITTKNKIIRLFFEKRKNLLA